MKLSNVRNMKRMKTILAAGLGLAVAAAPTLAQNPQFRPPAPPSPAAPDTTPIPGLPTEKDRLSYSIGMQIGNSLKRGNFDIDSNVLFGAMNDVLAGQPTKMTEAQVRDAFNVHSRELKEKQAEETRKTSEKNRKEGDAFLAENKSKGGVKIETVSLGGGTNADMQYKVIVDGTGESPNSNSMVTVSYSARLIDGKEFENTTNRPNAAKIMLTREMMMVRGLAEALKMMRVGSQWEVYLPSSLAFGDRGYRGMGSAVEPGATVIYDIQLKSIDAPPAPTTAPPLTSDIIRVPSAEEIKAGKKVEVLKQEDVARMQATNGVAPKQ
jgi:FKBP-type peptidyl-prolyl cis-trans isomerase FklB